MSSVTNIRKDLDVTYNSEYKIILDSTRRDAASYPNPNNFQLRLQKDMTSCIQISLTHFIMYASNIPSPFIYIIVDEIDDSLCYAPGIGKLHFVVPGGSPSYVSNNFFNDTVSLPKTSPRMIQTFTIHILDANLNPININNFVIRFYCRAFN